MNNQNKTNKTYEIFNDFTGEVQIHNKIGVPFNFQPILEDKNLPNITPIKNKNHYSNLNTTSISNSALKINKYNFLCEECGKIIEEGELILFCECIKTTHYSCIKSYDQKSCKVCSNSLKIDYLITFKDEAIKSKIKNTNINNFTLEQGSISNLISEIKDLNINDYGGYISTIMSNLKHDKVQSNTEDKVYNNIELHSIKNNKERKVLNNISSSHSPYFEKSTNNKTKDSKPLIKSLVNTPVLLNKYMMQDSCSPDVSIMHIKQKLNFQSPDFLKFTGNNQIKELNSKIDEYGQRNEELICQINQTFMEDNKFRKEEVSLNSSNFLNNISFFNADNGKILNNHQNESSSKNLSSKEYYSFLFDRVYNDFIQAKQLVEENIATNQSSHAEENIELQNKRRVSRVSIDKRHFSLFRKLQLDDDPAIYEQTSEDSAFIPKESTKLLNDLASHLNPICIEIESGVSHINICNNYHTNSLPLASYDIPMSIEVSVNSSNNGAELCLPNYNKYYLIIINSKMLQLESYMQIFNLIKGKISDGDKVWSNAFDKDKFSKDWLDRIDLDSLSNEILILNKDYNYIDFLNIINHVLEFSLDITDAPLFEVIFISDSNILKNESNQVYMTNLFKLAEKVQSTRATCFKCVRVNTLSLIENNNSSSILEENIFLSDISMMFSGCFYPCNDLKDLLLGTQNILDISEQTSLFNCDLFIEGNQDIALFIDILNYTFIKTDHNKYEISIGNLLIGEKKKINLLTRVLISEDNKNTFSLPLLNCHVEYSIQKSYRERLLNVMNNLRSLNKSELNIVKQVSPSLYFYIPVFYDSHNDREKILNKKVILRQQISLVSSVVNSCISVIRNKIISREDIFFNDNCLSMIDKSMQYIKKEILSLGLIGNDFEILARELENKENIILHILNYLNNCNEDQYDEIRSNLKHLILGLLCISDLNLVSNILKKVNNGESTTLLIELISIKNSLEFERPMRLKDERFTDDCLL